MRPAALAFSFLLVTGFILLAGCTQQQPTPPAGTMMPSPSYGTTGTPPNQPTTGPTDNPQNAVLSIITPYVEESDVASVNEAYSLREKNPYWGFRHPGVDFGISKESIPVRAAVDGTIINLETKLENPPMGWHTGFCIDHPPYAVCYNLEIFSTDKKFADMQSQGMLVKNGDFVRQGDVIGNLVRGGDGAHIDFGVIAPPNNDRVCPEPYFTDEARESILRLIRKDHPDWPICDTGSDAPIASPGPSNAPGQPPAPTPRPPHEQVVSESLPDCPSSALFSASPMDFNSFRSISPLGNVNPPSHTVPTDHVYLLLKMQGSETLKANVYAPADATIYQIQHAEYVTSTGKSVDDAVFFMPCRQVRAYVGHLQLSDALKKLVANEECVGVGITPPGSKQCVYYIRQPVKAGELLGVAGGPDSGAQALDFGAYDSRASKLFANAERYQGYYVDSVCPIDYYGEPLKSSLAALLGFEGNKRTKEPRCGTVEQDAVGTAQGNWFDGPSSDGSLENMGKAVSLIHDNLFGVDGKLVLGGEVGGPGIAYFTPRHSGTVNREPSEIKANGKIYCYQTEPTQVDYMPLSGKTLVQLVDANTLKVEYKQGQGTCTKSESFDKPMTYER